MTRSKVAVLVAAFLTALCAGRTLGQDVAALEREFHALDFKVRQWERLQAENKRVVVPPGFPQEVARYRELAALLPGARAEQAVRIAEQEQAKEGVFAALTGKKSAEAAVELLDAQIKRLLAENALVEKIAATQLSGAKENASEALQRLARAWEPERKAQSLAEVKDIFVGRQRQLEQKLSAARQRRLLLAGAQAVLAGPGLKEAIDDGDFFAAAEKAIDTGTTLAETVYDEETFKAASARLGAGKASLGALNKALSGDYLGSASEGLAAVDSLVEDVSGDLAKESGTLQILLETDFPDPELNDTARRLIAISSERTQKLQSVHRLKQGVASARSVLGKVEKAWSFLTTLRAEVDSLRAIAAVPGRSGASIRLIGSMSVMGRLLETGSEYLPPGLKQTIGPMLSFYGQALQLGDAIDQKIRGIFEERGDCLNVQGGRQFGSRAVEIIESRFGRGELCLREAEEFKGADVSIYVDDPDGRPRIEPPYFFIPDMSGDPTPLTSDQYRDLQRVAAAFTAYTTIFETGYALSAADIGAIIAALSAGQDEFAIDDGFFSGTKYRISELEEDARILVRIREAVGEQLTPDNARDLIAAWKSFERDVEFASQMCSFEVFPTDQEKHRVFANFLADPQGLRAFVTRRRLMEPTSGCRARVSVKGPQAVEATTPSVFRAEPSAYLEEVKDIAIEWRTSGTATPRPERREVEVVFDRPGRRRITAVLIGRIGDQRLTLAESALDVVVNPGPPATPVLPPIQAPPTPSPLPSSPAPPPPAAPPPSSPSSPPSPATQTPTSPATPPPAPAVPPPSAGAVSPGTPAPPPIRTPGPSPAGPASPPLTPIGTTSSASPAGTSTGGLWTLVGASDSQQPCQDWEEGGVGEAGEGATNHRIKVSGSSISTSYTDVATGRTVTSASSWTELPTSVSIPGSAPAIAIRVRGEAPPRRGGDPGPRTAPGAGAMNLSLPGAECEAAPRTVVLPAGFSVTGQGSWGGLASTLGTGTKSGERRSISIVHSGGGGRGTRTYTYEWQGNTGSGLVLTPLGQGFDVAIAVDKPVAGVGEPVMLRGKVEGGVPPFRYAWEGPAKGDQAELTFTAREKGAHSFRLTVTDSRGAMARDAATVEALPLEVRLTSASTQVTLGQRVRFTAVLTAGGRAVTGPFVYRWQPHPEVEFEPFESRTGDTRGRFGRPEAVKVWVQVLRSEGSVLTTVAESGQQTVEVVAPRLSLRAEPTAPLPGQETRVIVTEDPPIEGGVVSYWWEVRGRAQEAGALADDRQYGFRPADGSPVTVIVHGKALDGGADLGQESLTIVPASYEVVVSSRASGMPGREWNPAGGGLRDVSSSPVVFQDVMLHAEVRPQAQSVGYAWSVSPSGCSLSNDISQDPRLNCSQAGSYTATVTARDPKGSVLGTGSTQVTVLSPPPPRPIAPTPVPEGPGRVPLVQPTPGSVGSAAVPGSPRQPASSPGERPLDPKLREKALKLRAEGEKEEGKNKLKNAVEKYRKSLEILNDPGLAQHVRGLEPRAEQQEREKNAERQFQLGVALEQLGLLDEAIGRYKKSLEYENNPGVANRIRTVQARQQAERAADAAAAAAAAAAPPPPPRAENPSRPRDTRQPGGSGPPPTSGAPAPSGGVRSSGGSSAPSAPTNPPPTSQPQTPPPAPGPRQPAPQAPAQPPPPSRPAECQVSGAYEGSGEGVNLSFRLAQSGDRVSGTIEAWGSGWLPSGGRTSGSIDGTRSGANLSLRNPDGEAFGGVIASDCGSITLTMTVDGETGSITLTRR